ncbi:MAG: glycosyltransferase [Moorea sp. SIO1F2]|uniref:glycosyltransferase n=1 Tax=Moorena sp. SIO1F2 TaxID=2607819 RepID=UPI0013B711E4|nr:glycosyltransferase [Moorena sp. SIO1F2]NET85484.1 glycosyltransferase [Moorena sp. SIO1F2]
MPTISVIVPVYNGEKTILETIQSIQAQRFSDFELIVINDGSTDGTLDVISTVKDHRLKVFSYENGGLPVARNRGIRRSRGEFITFIDADDLWKPDKLELQLAALHKNPEAGVAYSWTAFIDDNSKFLFAWQPLYWEGNVYPQLLIRNFISSGSNIMVKRKYIEAAGEFDPSLKSVEDWDYYLRLAALCPFALVPKYQILYRRSSQSMTSKVDVMEKANLIVIERAFKAAPPELKSLKNKSLANAYRYLAKQCIANAFDDEGVKLASQKLSYSIKLYPKFLLSKETIRLILKLLIIKIMPKKLAGHLIQLIGQKMPMVSVDNRMISEH